MSNDKTIFQNPLVYLKKRLSCRIFLMLFLAFLSLELLFLYPITRFYEITSLKNLEQQALLGIRTVLNTLPTKASDTNQRQSPNQREKMMAEKPTEKAAKKGSEKRTVKQTSEPSEETAVQNIAQALLTTPPFKGVVITHGDGTPFLRVGEKPDRPMNDLPKFSYLTAKLRDDNGTRYDVFWDNEEDDLPYDIIARLDTSSLDKHLVHFTIVIFTIMLLAALLNSLLALIVIKKMFLNYLIILRNKIFELSTDGLPHNSLYPDTSNSKPIPEHELGDLERKYKELFNHFIDGQKVIKAHDAVFEMRVHERTKELSELANYDALTKLPNRNLLNSTLNQYIEQAKKDNKNIVLMIVSLRDFHEINNAYGHILGADLLNEVARHLIESLPAHSFIAHLSTSHFAIAKGGLTSSHHIANLAQWVVDTFNKPLTIQTQNLLISVNIGLSIYPIDGNDAESMIANAYLALKRAISIAPNSYQFYETNMNKITETRRSILLDLHYAIERQELIAYYQPQVDLETQQIIGVEALLRWMHPEKGLMPPAFFISLAEESGLIVPMGKWILQEACQQIQKWESEGLPKLTAAVNLSAAQFKQKNILEVIHQVLLETGLPPEQLELEITESTIVDNIEEAISIMKALRGLGLSISIDDFGTGYSSLNYLRHFPIQKLKIDQSFVKDIGHTGKEKPLVDIILILAQNMNIRSIAEGIETKEQAEYLRARGCQEGQGYLYGKPMGASEIKSLFS